MIAKDLQADLKVVLQNCSEDLIFRRLTDAVTLLANSGNGQWDGSIGQMTIEVDRVSGCITLPRDVLTPLQINLDGHTTFPRDKYFKYHFNGPGSNYLGATTKAWDDVGEFPVFREPSEPTTIRIESDDPLDNGQEITVFYFDTDDREYSHTFTLDSDTPQVSTFTIKRISRVAKDHTAGEVFLYYTTPELLAGWYAADEVDPMYRRIRVNAQTSVELIYRRRSREITSWESYIPLENHLAVIQAVRSVKARFDMQMEKALQFEADAVRLLTQEQNVRDVNSPVGPQVLDYSSENNDTLHGWRGR